MKKAILIVSLILVAGIGIASLAFSNQPEISVESETSQKKTITVRTENFPRPPYSGATYYIYESDGKAICTKLEVCNKFNDCETTYKKGVFKDDEDVETGDPYGKTDVVIIAPAKLKKHACLTKFKLIP